MEDQAGKYPAKVHKLKGPKKARGKQKTGEEVVVEAEEVIRGRMASWFSCEQASLITAEEVLKVLRVDPTIGLESHEAHHRREIHGLNMVGVKTPDPLWKKYLEQFNNPLILLLLASTVISVIMGQYDDAICVTLAIVIVVTVGFVQEYRSEKTLERMGALLPPSCNCRRDKRVDTIYAKYLVPGDVVSLTVGDRIPADLRLLQINELAVDESSFTGETEPKYKTAGAIDRKVKMTVNDMSNIGFQGTLVIHGTAVGVVVCTGEKSQFGEVFKMMQAEEPPRTPLQKNMDTLGKQLTLYSLAVITAIVIIGVIQGKSIMEMFNVGVSLAVAAIPEGLPIVVTVTLAFGVMRMAKKNAIVKRLPTVEALGCVDWVCSDKTGTLTTNQLKVSNLITAEDAVANSETPLERMNTNGMRPSLKRSLEVMTLCNNCHKSLDGNKGSPMEKALMDVAEEMGFRDRRDEYERVKEIPFSSERKAMTVLCQDRSTGSREYFVKGAPEIILEQCSTIDSLPFTDALKTTVYNRISWLCNREFKRVIALAKGSDLDNNSLQFAGLVAFLDPPRPDVHESVATLENSKVRVCMITGDGEDTARGIASMIGLSKVGLTLFSGADVDKMHDRELEDAVEKAYCFYRTTPRHKVRIVKALQANGHIVAMTGDGVNDGVAIKKADVGISMGETGTDVCKEAADMILLDDDFTTILSAIEEGKCIFYNIQNFVRFQLSTSIAALLLISLSTLLDIPNPLNAMQILWINVIMDGPPAQSLGLEPVDHDVLKRPPRKKKDQILTRDLIFNVLLSASVILGGTLWVFWKMMEDGKMTARDTTMTFTCFVFFDMFNALSSRSQERFVWEIGFFSNRFFIVAVSLSILCQLAVIYAPPLQFIFQTEALTLTDLLFLTALSSSVFFICEGKKLLMRLKRPAKGRGKKNQHVV